MSYSGDQTSECKFHSFGWRWATNDRYTCFDQSKQNQAEHELMKRFFLFGRWIEQKDVRGSVAPERKTSIVDKCFVNTSMDLDEERNERSLADRWQMSSMILAQSSTWRESFGWIAHHLWWYKLFLSIVCANMCHHHTEMHWNHKNVRNKGTVHQHHNRNNVQIDLYRLANETHPNHHYRLGRSRMPSPAEYRFLVDSDTLFHVRIHSTPKVNNRTHQYR